MSDGAASMHVCALVISKLRTKLKAPPQSTVIQGLPQKDPWGVPVVQGVVYGDRGPFGDIDRLRIAASVGRRCRHCLSDPPRRLAQTDWTPNNYIDRSTT